MKKIVTRLGATGAGLAIAVSSIAGISASALSQTSSSANDPSTYVVPLHSLNNSGVTGFARLSLNDNQPGATLTASVNARGAEPSQVHPLHIHGMLDGSDAECPTTAADVNNDRLVSVFEGAPFYGPIKVNFTDPPTMFGPPSRTDLFAPFAGIPVASNFPNADTNGGIQYNQNIPFDVSNQYAVQALSSITPLSSQHIVVHGGYAPESVSTPGGSPTKIVYDALLPVACGSIVQTHRGSINSQDQKNNENFDSDSTNTSTNSSTNRSDITNSSNITSSNTKSQTSASGNVKINRNTFNERAGNGSAMNFMSSSASLKIAND